MSSNVELRAKNDKTGTAGDNLHLGCEGLREHRDGAPTVGRQLGCEGLRRHRDGATGGKHLGCVGLRSHKVAEKNRL